jgi:alpha-1,2-mannosyltransferase
MRTGTRAAPAGQNQAGQNQAGPNQAGQHQAGQNQAGQNQAASPAGVRPWWQRGWQGGRRRTSVLVLAAGLVAAAVSAARFGVHIENFAFAARMFDLGIYRDGGLIVRHAYHFRSGHPTPLYDWVSPGGGNPFTYPPFAAGLFALASYLPLSAFQWAMTTASIGALAAAIWLTLGSVGVRGRTVRAGLALGVSALALWAQPVQSNLGLGQVNILLMAAIIADLRPRPDGRASRWTGVATGIAAGLKLTPLIFIPYLLVTRRFRQAAMATAAFAATIAVAFAAMPGASALYWGSGLFARVNGSSTANVQFYFASAWNQSLRGILSRLLQHGQVAAGPWLLAAAVTAIAGLLAAAWLHADGLPMLGLLTCALTGLLISPVSWLHHWVWVAAWIAAAAGLAVTARGAARWTWLAIATALTLVFGNFPRLPFDTVDQRGLDLITDVNMKAPYSWHGPAALAGNAYVLVGLAGVLTLFAWGIVRAWRLRNLTLPRASSTPVSARASSGIASTSQPR